MSPSSYRTASAPLDSFDTASDDARVIVIDRPNAPRTNAPRVPPRAIVVARDGVFRIIVVILVVAVDRSIDSPASHVARARAHAPSRHLTPRRFPALAHARRGRRHRLPRHARATIRTRRA
jgi:hypothetical protein